MLWLSIFVSSLGCCLSKMNWNGIDGCGWCAKREKFFIIFFYFIFFVFLSSFFFPKQIEWRKRRKKARVMYVKSRYSQCVLNFRDSHFFFGFVSLSVRETFFWLNNWRLIFFLFIEIETSFSASSLSFDSISIHLSSSYFSLCITHICIFIYFPLFSLIASLFFLDEFFFFCIKKEVNWNVECLWFFFVQFFFCVLAWIRSSRCRCQNDTCEWQITTLWIIYEMKWKISTETQKHWIFFVY